VVVLSVPGKAASLQVSVSPSSPGTISQFKESSLRSADGGQPLPVTYTELYHYNITQHAFAVSIVHTLPYCLLTSRVFEVGLRGEYLDLKGNKPITVAARSKVLRCEMSSLARTLGSWVRIPLKAWMPVLCAFILFVLLCM
jgi:hypothetical protein